MPNHVTLTPEQALEAMHTLGYAENYLFNMLPNSEAAMSLRYELIELRRTISRQYNGVEVPAAASAGDLGSAAYNMTYAAFREALDLEDDAYARDKYEQFKGIGRAMHGFSDTTLAILGNAYKAGVRA